MPATPESVGGAHSAATGPVLAFDVGRKLIGVAIGQRTTGSARPLATVAAGGGAFDWPALDALVAEWQPDCFVIGLPLALDGSEQEMTRFARAFGKRLVERYARPVHEIDERHTSQEASRRFAAQRAQGIAKRKHAAAIDALAAQIILEAWLSMPAETTGLP